MDEIQVTCGDVWDAGNHRKLLGERLGVILALEGEEDQPTRSLYFRVSGVISVSTAFAVLLRIFLFPLLRFPGTAFTIVD